VVNDLELAVGEVFESIARTGKIEDDPIVIGVMKDFHYSSLTVGVEPMLIRLSRDEQLNNLA